MERVRHYSINGCMHVVPISLRFRGGRYENGNTTVTTLYHQYISTVWEVDGGVGTGDGGRYENGNTTVTTLYHQYISTVWEVDGGWERGTGVVMRMGTKQ